MEMEKITRYIMRGGEGDILIDTVMSNTIQSVSPIGI